MRSLILTLFFSFSALATEPGIAIKCGKKYQLYDFYEVSNTALDKFEIWEDDPQVSMLEYVSRGLRHIYDVQRSLSPNITEKINIVFSRKNTVFTNDVPGKISDVDIVFLPKGCTPVKVSFWDDQNNILYLHEEITNKLSNRDYAGLMFHEAFYRFSREVYPERTSTNNIRKTIGLFFSDQNWMRPDFSKYKTAEEKEKASKPYCVKSMKLITDQLPLYTKITQGCIESKKDPEYVAMFQKVKGLLQDTLDDCFRDCFSEEFLKECHSTKDLILSNKLCD